MAVKIAETNPLDGNEYPDGYKTIIAVNFGQLVRPMHGRIEFGVWANQQAYLDGRPMIRQFGEPLQESTRRYLTESDTGLYVDANGDILDNQDDESLRVTIVPSVVDFMMAAVPSEATNMKEAVRATAYLMMANHPELAGGVAV